MCKFNLAWIGQCEQESETGFCEEHSKIKCCSCGEQATKECSETAQFVCGFPLCDNCEHTICENGCNSGAPLPEGLKGHCKKNEQVYLPWYMREEKEVEKKVTRIKVIYRKNLKMTEGKVAAQVAHAVKNLGETPKDSDIIVLKVSDKKFTELTEEHDCYIQIDKGLTEVDGNTPTAAAWIVKQ